MTPSAGYEAAGEYCTLSTFGIGVSIQGRGVGLEVRVNCTVLYTVSLQSIGLGF